jgi:hypothetical protein
MLLSAPLPWCRIQMQSMDDFVETVVNAFHQELFLNGIGQSKQGIFPAYIRARWRGERAGVLLLLHWGRVGGWVRRGRRTSRLAAERASTPDPDTLTPVRYVTLVTPLHQSRPCLASPAMVHYMNPTLLQTPTRSLIGCSSTPLALNLCLSPSSLRPSACYQRFGSSGTSFLTTGLTNLESECLFLTVSNVLAAVLYDTHTTFSY